MVKLLNKNPDSRGTKEFKDIKNFLEKCDFLRNHDLPLSDSDKMELCKKIGYKKVDRGDHVYTRGEENNKIFFIIKGKAVVTYPAKTDKEK